MVSTLEGVCLDSLRNHANPTQEVAVNPLNEDIRKRIAGELLQTYNKRLDGEQVGCCQDDSRLLTEPLMLSQGSLASPTGNPSPTK